MAATSTCAAKALSSCSRFWLASCQRQTISSNRATDPECAAAMAKTTKGENADPVPKMWRIDAGPRRALTRRQPTTLLMGPHEEEIFLLFTIKS